MQKGKKAGQPPRQNAKLCLCLSFVLVRHSPRGVQGEQWKGLPHNDSMMQYGFARIAEHSRRVLSSQSAREKKKSKWYCRYHESNMGLLGHNELY